MLITLYVRTYAVAGAPVAVSFFPFPPLPRHTFTAGGVAYEAECTEVRVVVPDGATISGEVQRLSWSGQKGPLMTWAGEKGPVKSTAREVLEFARQQTPGFRMAE